MLREIDIKFFQAHKKLSLKLHEGVNVITGQSDIGKSSIIRAFEWVRKNKPTGDSVKTWGIEKPYTTSVKIVTTDGDVAKERESQTVYKAGKRVFKAVKTDVPEEISTILNMSDYNVQTQHQGYFLLQKSPGEVAKELNELVGLDIIDQLFKYLNSRISNLDSDIKQEEQSISTLKEEIQAFDFIEEADELISDLEKKLTTLKKGNTFFADLVKLTASITEIDAELEQIDGVVKLDEKSRKIIEKIETLSSKEQEFDNLSVLIDDLKAISNQIEDDQPWIDLEPTCDSLTEKIADFSNKEISKRDLASIMNDINFNESELQLEKGKETIAVEKYLDLLREEKICPICQTPIGDKIINHIKEELL
jgi:DNA repair protein SbcC/Rad50